MKRNEYCAMLLLGWLVLAGGCENKSAQPGASTSLESSAAGHGAEAGGHPRAGWLENYEAALAKSKESGKPILADFTGSDWCPPCIAMDKEIFSSQAFKDWAPGAVVLLELDFPNKRKLSAALKKQNDGLAQKYGLRSYPTVMILDSAGEVLGQTVGYNSVSVEDWIKSVNGLLGR